MMQDYYKGYLIKANPVETKTGKWAVSVIIEKEIDGKIISKNYYADDNIHYILEIEAEKECINLGKNLINLQSAGF